MRLFLTTWERLTTWLSLALSVLSVTAYAGIDDYPNPWRSPTSLGATTDTWRYYNRYCTSFVAWRLHSRNGFEMPSGYGDAGDWSGNAQNAGYTVNSTPAVGAVAYWSVSTYPRYGHVAWVEAVNGSSVTVEEYNFYTSGGWDERKNIAATNPTGYIHFKDISGGSSSPANVPLVGDVNGDGKADAVLVNPSTGNVWAALSTGSGFSSPGSWSTNVVIANATKYFVADVNGDGMADIVAFFASTGSWYVGTSSGTGFWGPTSWASNEGANSTSQFLADVNGDGKADVVLFWNNVSGMPQGTWAVDTSTGTGFSGPPSQWINGAGVGSTSQVVGDFNGDGKADVGMYYASTGVWNVCLSTSTSFGSYPGTWSSGHGMGSNLQFAGDCDGDGKADIAYFWSTGSIAGTWQVGTSAGSGFWSPTYWATGQNNGSTTQFLAKVTGGTKVAVVAYWAAVPGQPAGMWTVDTSSGSGFYGPPSQWITGFGNNYQ